MASDNGTGDVGRALAGEVATPGELAAMLVAPDWHELRRIRARRARVARQAEAREWARALATRLAGDVSGKPYH